MIMYRGFAEASGFGAGIATRDASGQLIFNATGAVPEGFVRAVPVLRPMRFIVQAPSLQPSDLANAVASVTKVVLPPGLSASASNVMVSWQAVPASQAGRYTLTQSVAVGRSLPVVATGTDADLAQAANKIRTITGVVSVELDTLAQDTGTTANPATGTLPEEGATVMPKPKPPEESGMGMYLGLGVAAVAAYFLLKK
jgi:hypothetical protein